MKVIKKILSASIYKKLKINTPMLFYNLIIKVTCAEKFTNTESDQLSGSSNLSNTNQPRCCSGCHKKRPEEVAHTIDTVNEDRNTSRFKDLFILEDSSDDQTSQGRDLADKSKDYSKKTSKTKSKKKHSPEKYSSSSEDELKNSLRKKKSHKKSDHKDESGSSRRSLKSIKSLIDDIQEETSLLLFNLTILNRNDGYNESIQDISAEIDSISSDIKKLKEKIELKGLMAQAIRPIGDLEMSLENLKEVAKQLETDPDNYASHITNGQSECELLLTNLVDLIKAVLPDSKEDIEYFESETSNAINMVK